MLEYDEYVSEDGFFTVRAFEHSCEDPTCQSCGKGFAWAWAYNSTQHSAHRWLVVGATTERDESPFRAAVEEPKEYSDVLNVYGRISSMVGNDWRALSENPHDVVARHADIVSQITSMSAPEFLPAIRSIKDKDLQFFVIPDGTRVKQTIDRIKTLLAFPQLYKPKVKSKKKKD